MRYMDNKYKDIMPVIAIYEYLVTGVNDTTTESFRFRGEITRGIIKICIAAFIKEMI